MYLEKIQLLLGKAWFFLDLGIEKVSWNLYRKNSGF